MVFIIKIYLGFQGAGKSLYSVREMVLDGSGRNTYTNLNVKELKNVKKILPQHIILKKEDEKGKVKFEFNINFWIEQQKPLNVIWDEIHLSGGNARSSLSRANLILGQFISMSRRITGFDKKGYGHFTFLAQKWDQIDKNIRDLATEIKYFMSRWIVLCNNCKEKVARTCEQKQIDQCMFCGSWDIEIKNLTIEVWEFDNWDNFFNFKYNLEGKKHQANYIIDNPHEYFKYYDTLQIENMWEDYITND